MAVANPVDGEYLFRLAREKSAEGRAALTETIAELFDASEGILSDRERSLMFDILEKVVGDVELSIRRRVSEKIADMSDVPRSLAMTFAKDDARVAYPVLTRSRVLRDEDLIEIVDHRAREHQLAIAARYAVSAPVSDALVRTGEIGVIRELLKNRNAEISQATMEFLVEQSRRVDSFQEPILRREDLPPYLAKRMFCWVSAALRQHILDNYDLDQDTVDDLLEQAALEEFEAIRNHRPNKSEGLADKLKSGGMITPDFLISALREGEVQLFLQMFCHLTGLRETMAMRILYDVGGEGLAIACKAVGMGKAYFSALFTVSRRSRPVDKGLLKRETRHVLNLFDQMTEEAAKKVLRMWQRDRDYLAAIRDLELNEDVGRRRPV